MAAREQATRQRNELGPTGDQVRANVRALRDHRGLTTTDLAKRLAMLRRPILATGITKIESGDRRVDVGDLVALAIALKVTPDRLLLPVGDPDEEVALTPGVTVRQGLAWSWARGESWLAALAVAIGEGHTTLRDGQEDFRRHALPASERLHGEHTAVRAAEDVLDRVRTLLDEREELQRDVYDDAERQELRERSAPALRRALARLVAEVDDLIGDDRGDG